MTPAQMKEGRRLLGWSMDRLANTSGMTIHMIRFYELTGEVRPMSSLTDEEQADPVGSCRVALEAAGVVFTNGDEPGVKLRKVDAIV